MQRNNSKRNAVVATTRQARVEQPRQRMLPNGNILVSHCEFISDVAAASASGVFQAASFPVNPGMFTFPWLSGIAPSYESYRFRKLRFRYETTSATSTVGTVMLVVDYDAADSVPASKAELMSNFHAVRTAPWAPVEFVCDQRNLDKFGGQGRYVRVGAVAGTDIKTYDVGNLVIATSDFAAAVMPGELYVEYEVELMTPQSALSSLSARSGRVVGNISVTDLSPFGSDPIISGSAIVSAVSGPTDTFTIGPSGEYLLTWELVGTTLTRPVVTPPSGVTVTALSTAVGTTRETFQWILRVVSPNAVIAVNTSAAGSVTASDMRIAPYSFALG